MRSTEFNLQVTVPGEPVADEWRDLVAQQAGMLNLMLDNFRVGLNALQDRTDLTTEYKVAKIQTLARETDEGLAGLAQSMVAVEQQLAKITERLGPLDSLPPERAAQVRALDQVVTTLHANLLMSRQTLITMLDENQP